MFNIPLFDLNFDEREAEAVLGTIRSKWISMGPKCAALEEKFAKLLGVKYAVALTNCTAALHLACCVADIGPEDEVICPSMTFSATVNCIRYVNGIPVFADISGLDNLCLDSDGLESLITEKTKAIIPMHYGGFPCDMDRIMDLAQKYHLFVIEDACHGPLSEYKGRKVGTIGDIGCFSFFSNKNISTGEGGMLVTDNEEIYKKVKLLRSHGMTTMSYQRSTGHATKYDVVALGFNYRMDDIRASIGIVQLDKLQSDLERRSEIRTRYIKNLRGCDKLTIPFLKHREFSSNYIFSIVLNESNCERRDLIRAQLADNGIQTSVHYPAVHKFSIYENYTRSLPRTEYVTDNEITLPMYASLKDDEIDYICDTLIEVIG